MSRTQWLDFKYLVAYAANLGSELMNTVPLEEIARLLGLGKVLQQLVRTVECFRWKGSSFHSYIWLFCHFSSSFNWDWWIMLCFFQCWTSFITTDKQLTLINRSSMRQSTPIFPSKNLVFCKFSKKGLFCEMQTKYDRSVKISTKNFIRSVKFLLTKEI